MTEAYSHEVSSCGFWPGNGGYGRGAFYMYAYPEPEGYGDTRLSMSDGFYDKNVGQFILPYDAVRAARDPDALLLSFCRRLTQPRLISPSGIARPWNAHRSGAPLGRAGPTLCSQRTRRFEKRYFALA